VAKKGFQISYIDDFSITVSSTLAAKNYRALTAIYGKLFSQAAENSTEFAPEKTELIHFSSKRETITEGITVGSVFFFFFFIHYAYTAVRL
jgi:hypothetical protein